MFKKLARKQILGLLAASAVVVTTMGTFAVWDTLEGTATGTLALSNPIVVSGTDFNDLQETHVRGTAPTYEGDVAFDVSGDTKIDETTLTLACTILDSKSQPVDSNKFTVDLTESGTSLPNGVDENVALKNTYHIKITPSDSAADLAGTALTVNVKGTLATKQPVAP